MEKVTFSRSLEHDDDRVRCESAASQLDRYNYASEIFTWLEIILNRLSHAGPTENLKLALRLLGCRHYSVLGDGLLGAHLLFHRSIFADQHYHLRLYSGQPGAHRLQGGCLLLQQG